MTLASALLGALLGTLAPLARPTLGPRGVARELALKSPAFAALEPAMRALAVPLGAGLRRVRAWHGGAGGLGGPAGPGGPGGRERTRAQLERAGNYQGLSPEELVSLCILSALGALCLRASLAALGWSLSVSTSLAVIAAFGAGPWLAVRDRARIRERAITRRLPALLDLLSLCMSAGTDFASALGLALRELGEPEHPLTQELERVRSDLALGQSRKDAFTALAARVPIAAVQELVAICVQAEQKGTPLSEVLALAASAARNRRSVLAEEAAARAAVLLLAPLGLLMLAIVLVLFAPFLINGFGG
jgi:tight adherence protein C